MPGKSLHTLVYFLIYQSSRKIGVNSLQVLLEGEDMVYNFRKRGLNFDRCYLIVLLQLNMSVK